MALIFYPHTEDVLHKGSLQERIDVLLEAASHYKAAILDNKAQEAKNGKKSMTPSDLTIAYNWEEIARVLREIRELPEATKTDKERKGLLLNKLAEVYEVLRSAKMPKLEAVRLALTTEANHLVSGSSSSQVA